MEEELDDTGTTIRMEVDEDDAFLCGICDDQEDMLCEDMMCNCVSECVAFYSGYCVIQVALISNQLVLNSH